MEYTISLMTLADVDEVVEIEKQSFPIPWSRAAFVDELTRNMRALYIAVRDESGTTVGYGGMWLVCDEAHVTNIAVRSDRRRQGVGTAVMIGLMGLAQSKGANRMTLEVRVSNRPAQELYSRLGFRPAGVRPRYYMDNREDALIMWLDGIAGALGALCGRQDADAQ
ncbi:MAG: ribosomal protein S18-alanine N-acetyltransferase [Firmicutes bacterium]|nr:ribosomal protein S18-alanine N-acetyltransferase [Bacillota bacterium]